MKKRRYSKWLIAFIVIINCLFAAAVLYVFLKTGKEPKTLIGCWFGWTTGELWLVASVVKNKNNKKDTGEKNGDI